MKKEKRERPEKAGWRVGSAQEFLELTDADSALVNIRLTLAQALRKRRLQRHISQGALARQLGSSQSRVAKMEAGDPSVSLDLLMRSLMVTGSTSVDIGQAISAANVPRPGRARKTA